jgi:hypothetical protein
MSGNWNDLQLSLNPVEISIHRRDGEAMIFSHLKLISVVKI